MGEQPWEKEASFPQLVLEPGETCAMDFCPPASRVPCEMNVHCEILFICTQKAADETPSPEEFSACSAICYKGSAN